MLNLSRGHVGLQCESVMASLEASHSVALNVGPDMGTPTGKLGSAAAHDNDRFINSEGDRQQLLLRSAKRASMAHASVSISTYSHIRHDNACSINCKGSCWLLLRSGDDLL